MHRLTPREYLTYTLASAAAVLAYHTSALDIPYKPRCILIVHLLCYASALITCLSRQHQHRIWRIPYSMALMLLLYLSGNIVAPLARWMQDSCKDLSITQVLGLHFSLCWFLVSEVDWWVWRVWDAALWPEYLYFPAAECEKWYKRLHNIPPSANISTYDPRKGLRSLWDWKNPLLRVSCFSMVSWQLCLLTTNHALRCVVSRNYMAQGRDTLIESKSLKSDLVQILLLRFVRVGLAAVYEWAGEMWVKGVERRRVERRVRDQEKERAEFAFYS